MNKKISILFYQYNEYHGGKIKESVENVNQLMIKNAKKN